jgi:2-methylcitrate dehydratase PrpD
VEEIKVETGPVAFTSAGIKRPKVGVEGKFSLWFLAALALAEGSVTLDKFTDERVKDPTVMDLMGKIDARLVRELKFGARVSVTMKDGSVFSGFRATPKGDPANPLTFEEICAKFRSVARITLPEGRIETLIEKVNSLEKQAGLGDMMALVASG